jgi:sulfate permease, SulP family
MKRQLFAALEALSSVVPSTLACVVWLSHKIGPSMMPSMILAVACGFAITNFAGSFSRRPLIYVTRFFEISLLVGFLDSFSQKLNAWGLVDSPRLRLTWVLAICVLAALIQIVFYTMKLQRLMRYIPVPVFAGFLNAVALVLVISEVRSIILLVQENSSLLGPSLMIAGLALAVALLTKRYQPKMPAGMLALAASSVTAFVMSILGHGLPTVLPGEIRWVLPITLLDISIFGLAPKLLFQMLFDLVLSGFLLAIVVFLNTALAAEVISQSDDRPEPSLQDSLRLAAGQVISACLGSAPISGGPAASMAAMRDGGVLEPAVVRLLCVFLVIFFSFNLVTWVPSAAIIGLLFFEASCLYDRTSVIGLRSYVLSKEARSKLSPFERDDLLCVGVVTVTGVLFNMVAALIAGMVFALVLFAKRNGKATIRDIRTVRHIRSNVSRSAQENNWLTAEGDRIKCVSLQGALYFGTARSLRLELSALLSNTSWLVLDWQYVTSQDGTLSQMLELFEKKAQTIGVQVVHASRASDPDSFQDLDRALEHCENQLVKRLAEQHSLGGLDGQSVAPREGIFFSGFDPAALMVLSRWLEVKHYQPGEILLAVGELKRNVHLIVQGRVDVLIGNGKIRVASVRAGAILGEANFLVGVRRAADAIALDRVTTQVLSYERVQELSTEHPEIARRLMMNLCMELVNRSRSLQMQIERERQ